MTGPQATSPGATYRTLRELGSRAQRTLAAIREPNELVVVQTFAHAPASVARDARALAKNWHPNLSRVRYVDTVGEELVVATDFLDGVTLEELFALGAAKRTNPSDPVLPLPVLARISVDILAGLQGLHGLRDESSAPLGAFHGAMCPRNVVVAKDGVARLVALFRPRPVRVVATSESLRYASPESLEQGSAADPRTDLYAAAAMLWEGILGKKLWDESQPARILQRQREEDLLRAETNDAVVAALGRVVLRALAFDPSVRFRSAWELATELRKAVGNQLATGTAVAQKVAELAGERIRTRRVELEPPGARKPTSTKMTAAPIAKPAAQTPAAKFQDEAKTARTGPIPNVSKPPVVPQKKPPPPITAKKPPTPPPAPVSDPAVQEALVSVRELPEVAVSPSTAARIARSEAETEPPPPPSVEPRLDPRVVLAPEPVRPKPHPLLAVTPTPPPVDVAIATAPERTTDAGVDVPISIAPRTGDEHSTATKSIALFLSQPVPTKKAAWVVIAVAIAMLFAIVILVVVVRVRTPADPALAKAGEPAATSAPQPKVEPTAIATATTPPTTLEPATPPSSTAAAGESGTAEPPLPEPPLPPPGDTALPPPAPPAGSGPATPAPVKKKPLYEPMGI